MSSGRMSPEARKTAARVAVDEILNDLDCGLGKEWDSANEATKHRLRARWMRFVEAAIELHIAGRTGQQPDYVPYTISNRPTTSAECEWLATEEKQRTPHDQNGEK